MISYVENITKDTTFCISRQQSAEPIIGYDQLGKVSGLTEQFQTSL